MTMRSSQPRERRSRELELETDAGAWHALLLGRLQSLRTAVAIVAVVALAALGVAVWALLHDNGGGTRRQGVSVARVRALENRVQPLEQRVPSQQDCTPARRGEVSSDASCANAGRPLVRRRRGPTRFLMEIVPRPDEEPFGEASLGAAPVEQPADDMIDPTADPPSIPTSRTSTSSAAGTTRRQSD